MPMISRCLLTSFSGEKIGPFLPVLGLLGVSQSATSATERCLTSHIHYLPPTVSSWSAVKASGFAEMVTLQWRDPSAGVHRFVDLLKVASGCALRPTNLLEHGAGPSPAGHFSLDLNDPNLNSWCTCLISARIRFNLYLMIFWLRALVNCQAEPVLKQARSGREGPDLSLVPESSVHIYTCNTYLQVAFKMSSYLD